jgi:hypothetical protein
MADSNLARAVDENQKPARVRRPFWLRVLMMLALSTGCVVGLLAISLLLFGREYIFLTAALGGGLFGYLFVKLRI